jgi:hypothetical protein
VLHIPHVCGWVLRLLWWGRLPKIHHLGYRPRAPDDYLLAVTVVDIRKDRGGAQGLGRGAGPRALGGGRGSMRKPRMESFRALRFSWVRAVRRWARARDILPLFLCQCVRPVDGLRTVDEEPALKPKLSKSDRRRAARAARAARASAQAAQAAPFPPTYSK